MLFPESPLDRQPWPHTQGANPPKQEAKTHHTVCVLGARKMEGPEELGGAVQNGFLEEASMGISKQFITVFKINIAFLRFLTS